MESFFAAGEPPAPSRAGRKKASSNHFELEVARPLVLGDIRYHRYRTIYPICMSSLSKGDLLPCSSDLSRSVWNRNGMFGDLRVVPIFVNRVPEAATDAGGYGELKTWYDS